MTHQLVTKTVAACLIPCVLLYAIGCGTSRQSTTSLKDLDKDATIIVWTTQGQFHRLLKWEADEKANITGAGSTFTSLEAANSDAMGSPFNGTIMASQITAIYEYSRMITSEVTAWTTLAIVLLGVLAVGAIVLLISSASKGCKAEVESLDFGSY